MAPLPVDQNEHSIRSPRLAGIRVVPFYRGRFFQNNAGLNVRGQASIEFVLLLVIVLLLLHTLVLPNYFLSKEIISDSQQLAQVRLNAQQLATAINGVSAGGIGSKQTVWLPMTRETYLRCATATPLNPSWYPAAWGPQRITFFLNVPNRQHPPLLPFSQNPGDPQYAVMVQNGGGCQVTGTAPDTVLECMGSIPVNADCSALNSTSNNTINTLSDHEPYTVRVSVTKETAGSVQIISIVESGA